MIGIVGTVVLLPIAIVALAIGLVRFGLNAARCLIEEGVATIGHRLTPGS